jgi:hypothetical protein
MENETVQRVVGDSIRNAVYSPETQKKAKDATKSMLSFGYDMAMNSAKQSFSSKT